jgi:hypothetical protein
MRAAARTPRDEGTSLVEVLVAVVILGIAVPALLSALATAALTSGVHRGQADAHIVLVSAAESLRDDARNPFSCTLTTYNSLAGVTLPAGWSAGNVRLELAAVPPSIDAPQSGYWSDGAFKTAACGAITDLQRLTLTATSPDGRADEQLTVFKRRP